MALSRRASAAPVGLLGLLLTAGPVAAQYEGRSFTVTATPARASVGDTVRLSFRLASHERDLLTDTVPRPLGEVPEGVQVFSVEKLRRGPDRVFRGDALVAFYRPGPREIPQFGIPWVQIVTGRRGAVTTEPATVEIVPVLPAGNPTLRDIRDPEPAPGPGPILPALAAALVAGLVATVVRRHRRGAVQLPSEAPARAAPTPADPYALALARLDALAHAGVEEVTAGAADTLRDYLEAAEAIPARERTSSELLWALPPRLTEGGLRRTAVQVLAEADLVKFARERPHAAAAAAHLGHARELLRRWHEARAAAPVEGAEVADAVR